ncbi:SO2930 family diheme c-type cytochrome [Aquirufa aurantiipilula]
MNRSFRLGLMILVGLAFIKASSIQKNAAGYVLKLSDYGFFKGDLKDQHPQDGVIPYQLNSPLFSDYASKLRFVKLPEGTKVAYNADSVFQFPIGTAIIKTFYYPKDEANPLAGRRIMETRVLIRQERSWVALPYIWDEAQTEATLEVAGGSSPVSWKDRQGILKQVNYQVPNMNQCKGCHERSGKMTPIGPSARQLHGDFPYTSGKQNQLDYWAKAGILTDLPNLQEVPALANYADESKSLDERAKAYLDINCAHCHNPTGPARSSGLYLTWDTKDKTAYGFMKTPVAAGRGSGNLKYDIVAGKAKESILAYRMDSVDPGIMMPELGRKMKHQEGIKLIQDWINSLQH